MLLEKNNRPLGESSHLETRPSSSMSWLTFYGGFDNAGSLTAQKLHLIYNNDEILHLGQSLPDEELRSHSEHKEYLNHILLPLFFESHAHMFLKGATLDFQQRKSEQNMDPSALIKTAGERAQALLEFGIGKVRDGGDNALVGLTLSKDRTLTTTCSVASPGSGVNRQKRYGSFFARNLEEFSSVEEVVDDRIRLGADHLKVVVTGIIDFEKGEVKGSPQFDVSTLKSLTSEAHRRGLKVMAHASGEDGVRRAVLGGVDSVEHGFFMSEEILKAMKERGTLWVPTFTPVQLQVDEADLMGWSELSRSNLRSILAHHQKMIIRAIELGVGVMPGSDAGSLGVPHGQGFLKELELMEDAGFDASTLLKLSCMSSHRLWFDEDIEWGIGSPSSFQMASKESLSDISSLRDGRKVIIQGKMTPQINENHPLF